MTTKNTALWQQIAAWDLTPEGSDICFERKLAMENGWTQGFASLVCLEYKKFLYLTQTVGALVCPSDEVDQAWHLHLTQTASYQRFCDTVCGGYLHHHASKGGEAELMRHKQMYEHTLQAYQSAFNAWPHPEIWPDVETRFSRRQKKPGSVALRRTVLLKHAALGIFFAIGLGVLSAVAGWGTSLWSGINGPQFLLWLWAGLASIVLLSLFLGRVSSIHVKHLALDPYELALLEGGYGRMLGTAATQLIGLGALRLIPQKDGDQAKINGALGFKVKDFDRRQLQGAHYVERTLYDALPEDLTKFDALDALGAQKMHAFEQETRLRLTDAGIAVDSQQIARGKGIPAYLTLALIAIAANRFAHGISLHHPVMFLLMSTLACFVMFTVFVHKGEGLSDLGACVMRNLRRKYASLRTEAALPHNQTQLNATRTGTMLAVGFALFGTQAVMASTDFAGVNFMFDDRHRNITGNSNSAGGCGGGGGGSGGSGCGGGCGGCGGGG